MFGIHSFVSAKTPLVSQWEPFPPFFDRHLAVKCLTNKIPFPCDVFSSQQIKIKSTEITDQWETVFFFTWWCFHQLGKKTLLCFCFSCSSSLGTHRHQSLVCVINVQYNKSQGGWSLTWTIKTPLSTAAKRKACGEEAGSMLKRHSFIILYSAVLLSLLFSLIFLFKHQSYNR